MLKKHSKTQVINELNKIKKAYTQKAKGMKALGEDPSDLECCIKCIVRIASELAKRL